DSDAGAARHRAPPPRLPRRTGGPAPAVPGRHPVAGAVRRGARRRHRLRLRRVARPRPLDRLLAGVAGLLLPAPLLGPGAPYPAGPRHLPRPLLLGPRLPRAP